ncbi:hypothetical protein [Microvirga brassicacearum]|uniref:Uncharacterized protein n=1 Tax=Microvirga brassicacearum TaxID=2580413 RepID=A0A5N3PH11_9HYPH|nr:hypothetical protein [Microvirga brassicacearum]KAB0269017.1 hypothetical protein FEZ63_02605 [Microvirga brassicacearum]
MTNTDPTNGTIDSAEINIARGFILESTIAINDGTSTQLFGGFILGGTPGSKAGGHETSPNSCAEWIVSIMSAAEAVRWSDLRGRAVRFKRDETGEIVAIGHITSDDHWFEPAAVFGSWKASRS